MAIQAEIFDGTILEFPDGTDQSIIDATARRVTLERQAGAPARDDLGEVIPEDRSKGSLGYRAISSIIDPIAQTAVGQYLGEQTDLAIGAARKGFANLQTAVAQSQVAGIMELQEARKAKYGTFENMPPDEQQNYLKAEKYIQDKLGAVAGYGLEKKAIEKQHGVRASTKEFDSLSKSKEYQEGSFFDKMGMIGGALAKDPVGIITDLGIESMPQSLAVAATAVAARVGNLNPKIAAGTGGFNSAMMEFGNTYAQLREEGLDHKEAWEKAGVKSGVIGLFDAASFYTAGKSAGNIVNNIQKGAVKETVKEVAKETGKQGALGAGGEGLGSFAIGQEIDPLELTKEAIGEIFGAPGEAISTYQTKVEEARASGKPDPEPPQKVRELMDSKGFTFKPRKTIAQELEGMDIVYPEESQYAEPIEPIEIKGVGALPEEPAPAKQPLELNQEPMDEAAAAQDYAAMLAELEGDRQIDRELKQVSVQPAVELTKEEEKAAPATPVPVKAIPQEEFMAKVQNPDIAGELQAMAANAGWAQVGGKLIRENMEDNTSAVTGRTQWIPKEPWWQGRPKGMTEAKTRNAVNKALAGEKLSIPEKRMLEYMVGVAESNLAGAVEERQRIEESDRKVAQFEAERRVEEAKAIADQFARMGEQNVSQAILGAINEGKPVTPAAIEYLRAKMQELSQPAPIELIGQTPEEARAEAEALEKQRAEQERVALEQQRIEREARERDEIARRSVGAAEEFQLGQTAEENLTGQKDIFAEPESKEFVRVYHSGSKGEGKTGRWVSTNKEYAKNYRSDLPLFYVDIPKNDPRVNNPDYADQGVDQGFTFNFELTPKEAAKLKPVEESKPAAEPKKAYEPPKLYQDNPGGEWLAGKRQQSIEAGKNKFGSPSRFGSVTGSFRGRNVLVPVEVLAKLKGVNAEQQNVREKDLEAIKKIMDETGRLPQHDGVDYAPFINVYQDGTAYVNEGNHRIMAAKALGFKYLPVEISYFNGAEQVEGGDLYPRDVIAYDMQANDDNITLDNYRGKKVASIADIKDAIQEGVDKYAAALVKNKVNESDTPATMGGRADAALRKVIDGIENKLIKLGISTARDARGNMEIEDIIYKQVIPQARKKAFADEALAVESMKRGADFASDGSYVVTLNNGDKYRIYRDTSSLMSSPTWRLSDPVNNEYDLLGWNKQEAIDELLKKVAAGKAKKFTEEKAPKAKTVKELSGMTDRLAQELKETPREGMSDVNRKAMELADEAEQLGQDNFATGIRAAVRANNVKNLKFYEDKVEEFRAQKGKGTEKISENKSMEDFVEGYDSDVKRLSEVKGLFATEASDMVDQSNEYIQKITDRVNQLGFRLLAINATSPQEVQKLKDMATSIAGSTTRLMKQAEALQKGYQRADENKFREVVDQLLQDYNDVDELLSETPKGVESKEDQDWDIPFNIERKFREPAAYEEVTRAPSLRVEMNKLTRQFNAGKIDPDSIMNRVEFALSSTKKEKKLTPRVRGKHIIKEKLNKAVRSGEFSELGLDIAEWFINQNPALVDDLGISLRTPPEGTSTSGYYKPMARIITLMKHSGNDETAVHEILHHTERMMPEAIQDGIRKSWFASLAKAAKKAQKGSDASLKKYYESLVDYHLNGNAKALKVARDLLENGDVGYEHYQHMNPSEFWAINAADIVAGRYAQSKSVVGKLKTWLKELYQKLKGVFRLQSDAPILRALDSLAKADGRFVTDAMIGEATDYLNRKNYKGGQAPLSAWQDPKDSKLDTFIYKIQDKLIDTKRVQEAIKAQVGEIEDAWNVYMKEELYHGRTAKRVQDFLKNELLPIINVLAKENINIGDFDSFLHNRHAEERNIQIAKINPNMPDSGSGISTADARQYMADLDPKKRAVMEKLADKIDAMVKESQKILVDNGVEEQSTIDAWNKAYKHYVPLKREDVDFVHTGTGLGQGFATRGGSSARATGSLKDVADIFANLALQRERAIIRAEKVKVGKALMGLAIKNPNPDFWLPVNPDAVKNKAALEQELVNMGLDPLDAKNLIQEPRQQYIDPRTGLVAWRVNPILRSSDNVFPVRINGQDRFIFFNSSDERAMRMVSALKNLDADQLDIVLSSVGTVTRWLASVNTQYNPVFGAWNFARDVQGAALNLSTTKIAGKEKQVLKGVWPALKGIYADLRSDGKATGEWSKLWEDFQEAGGQTGYRDQFAKNRRQANVIEREMKIAKRGITKRTMASIAQWLSDYNDSMENAVRLSAYKVALEQGLSKEQAASIAKNLTVNFNRKGQWSQTVGALYAFFNASVQGTTRLLETMKGPKGRKIAAGGFALGTLQAIALAAAGFDDDEPPEFIKSRNFIIPTGGKGYVMIPLPLGFNIFPNTGRMMTEFMLSGGKNPGKKVVDFMSMVFDSFNPVGGSGLQLLSPTIADPIAALYTNKDAFGRPIAKEDRATAPTPGYTRSRENATTFNKYLAEFLNFASGGTKYQKGYLSPTADQLDYLVGQFTGGVGREFMKGVSFTKSATTGEEIPPHKIPVVGKIYGNTESPANISSKFYENVTQLSQYENEIKGRRKNRENVSEFIKKHPEARLYERANQLENEVSKLNKTKKELIERNAPQSRIAVIEKRKTMLMDNFNKQVKRASEQR